MFPQNFGIESLNLESFVKKGPIMFWRLPEST